MKRRTIPYSAAELAWLEANRTMIISDYHVAFVAAFGRSDVSLKNLHALRKRKRWLVGRPPGRFSGRHVKFSKTEISWLETNCTLPIGEYFSAFCETFSRSDITSNGLHQLRKRMGWKTGRDGRFEKGAAPWSKGKKLPFNANRAATQFKQGQRPHTWRGAGHEATKKDGYVWIVVDETNPYTGADTRSVQKHRWLWEQANGPIPKGHVLKCLDGDKANTDPSNWELVPQELLPRLNGRFGRGFDAAPNELKPAIMAVTKLEHQARKARRAARS